MLGASVLYNGLINCWICGTLQIESERKEKEARQAAAAATTARREERARQREKEEKQRRAEKEREARTEAKDRNGKHVIYLGNKFMSLITYGPFFCCHEECHFT